MARLGRKRQPTVAVRRSPDFERIVELRRRARLDETSADAQELAEIVSGWYRRPDWDRPHDCRDRYKDRLCIRQLKPAQAWALHELEEERGLFAQLPVGSGKCHRAGTEFLDYSSGRRRDIAEPGGLRLATFDRTLRVENAAAFPSGRKSCVRVVLADGSTAEPSSDHPYLTARGWVHAGNLRVGEDFVAVARELPEPGRPTIASDDEVAFVAYMLSDGGCSQQTMMFTNATAAVIEDWSRCATALGYGISEAKSRSRARQFRLTVGRRRSAEACAACGETSRPVVGRQLCRRCYQRRDVRAAHNVRRDEPADKVRARWDLRGLAREKRAHADVWGLPRHQVALFLNRFWACDGHVAAGNLECTLASEKLVDDLRFLCARLGVRTSKHHKAASYVKGDERHKFDAWRISISGAAALRFLREVGDVLGKEEASRALRSKLESTKRNTNRDLVPVGPREVQEICDELGMNGVGQRGGQRGAVDLFLHPTRDQHIGRERFVEFCAGWNYRGKYSHLATTDVAWEPVASIEPIGEHDVYDVTVPATGNFVANGIIVHNTAVTMLAPLALKGCQVALLLVPSSTLTQFALMYDHFGEHWRQATARVHGDQPTHHPRPSPDGDVTLHVMPYSLLSSASCTAVLESMKPDLIIADECQRLKDCEAVRTRRFRRYLDDSAEAGRDVRVVALSGTVTDKSIMDYWHLLDSALEERSPVPRKKGEAQAWAGAIDPSPMPAPEGALKELCGTGEHVQDGYRRRLVETSGVVMSVIASSLVPVQMRQRKPGPLPEKLAKVIKMVRDSGKSPDEAEIFEDALAKWRCLRDLACGYWNRWVFPREEPEWLVKQWKHVRACWHSEVREMLSDDPPPYMDSPLWLARAAARFLRGEPATETQPTWDSEWYPEWSEIRDKVQPETEAEWIDRDYMVEDVMRWVDEGPPGIVWVEAPAFGQEIAKRARLPYYGDQATSGGALEILNERGRNGGTSIVASWRVHGTGRDGLQYKFGRNISTQPSASAEGWEQLIGRLARPGQTDPVVLLDVYGHTPEFRRSLKEAQARSEYVRRTTGLDQVLLRAALEVEAADD